MLQKAISSSSLTRVLGVEQISLGCSFNEPHLRPNLNIRYSTMATRNDDIPSVPSSRTLQMKDLFRKAKIWSRTQYKPLNALRNEIRLLRLVAGKTSSTVECVLFHVSLDNPPSYESLSYCWGTKKH